MRTETIEVRITADTSRLQASLDRAAWSADRCRVLRLVRAGDPNPFPRFHLFRRTRRTP